MPFDFSGKKFLVTGAAGCIGAALTRAIINAGGFVYALGRRNNVEELAKENGNIHPIVVGLADWEATREELEPVDGVVNNAARADGRFDYLTLSKDRLSRTLNVNVMAPVNIIRTGNSKENDRRKRGSIVNVSSGKRFLVTGAGRGIGRALVKAIVDAGREVYALSKSKDLLDTLEKESDKIHVFQVDLIDWETTRKIVDGIDGLHGVVNNAAYIDEYVDSVDMSKGRLEHGLSVNLMAPINIIQVTAKKMVEAGIHGSIVNISSIAGVNPLKRFLDYSVTKAGLDMVTKQFASELGRHQIRVNSVNPTFILVDRVKEEMATHPGRPEAVLSLIPLGRFGEVREAVEPIMYLLSGHSSMVTGTVHLVDGGMLSNIPV